MKSSLLLSTFFFVTLFNLSAQSNPVTWANKVTKIDDKNFKLTFEANIQPGWYLYSQYLESNDGPIPTSFSFQDSPQFDLNGKTEESGQKKEGFDELFGMNIVKYGKVARFVQKIQLNTSKANVAGFVEFMVCDDEQCLPPTQVDFSFEIN